jgi:hypothetical protein
VTALVRPASPADAAGNPHFQARKLPGYAEALRGEFGYCWE